MNPRVTITLLLLLLLPGTVVADLFNDNPLAHGAWLFRAHCTRCHGQYERQRPAEEYDDEDKLFKAVARDDCKIKWLRSAGGSLNPNEIRAVTLYMMTWEKNGGEPELPELPEIPSAAAAISTDPQPEQPATTITVTATGKEETLDPSLARLVATNPVASGAWLYTTNCYRCHLSYASARMGRNMQLVQLRKIIENGKTSTQMTGFSMLAGGKLKNSDIDAVTRYIETWERFDAPLAIAPQLLVPPAVDPSSLRPFGLPRFPSVSGNSEMGTLLFAQRCCHCHGPDRQGLIGRRLLPPWSTLRPDLLLKSTIKNGIPGSLMPSFGVNGTLTPKQIDDLVSFLLIPAGKPAVTQTNNDERNSEVE